MVDIMGRSFLSFFHRAEMFGANYRLHLGNYGTAMKPIGFIPPMWKTQVEKNKGQRNTLCCRHSGIFFYR